MNKKISKNGFNWVNVGMSNDIQNSINTAAYVPFITYNTVPKLIIGSNVVPLTDKLMKYLKSNE